MLPAQSFLAGNSFNFLHIRSPLGVNLQNCAHFYEKYVIVTLVYSFDRSFVSLQANSKTQVSCTLKVA